MTWSKHVSWPSWTYRSRPRAQPLVMPVTPEIMAHQIMGLALTGFFFERGFIQRS